MKRFGAWAGGMFWLAVMGAAIAACALVAMTHRSPEPGDDYRYRGPE